MHAIFIFCTVLAFHFKAEAFNRILQPYRPRSRRLSNTDCRNLWGGRSLSLKPRDDGSNEVGPLRLSRSLLGPSPAQAKLSLFDDGKDRSGSMFLCQLGGSQVWMERGRFYDVPRIKGAVGTQILLTRVTMYQSPDGEVFVGQPFLEQVRPIATILSHFRGPKNFRLKYKRKKRYRRLHGWRVEMSRLLIDTCVVQPDSITQSPNWRGYASDPLYQLITLVSRSPYPPGLHPTGGHRWPKSLLNMWYSARRYKPVESHKLPRDEPEPLLGFEIDDAERLPKLIRTGRAHVSPYAI